VGTQFGVTALPNHRENKDLKYSFFFIIKLSRVRTKRNVSGRYRRRNSVLEGKGRPRTHASGTGVVDGVAIRLRRNTEALDFEVPTGGFRGVDSQRVSVRLWVIAVVRTALS